MAPLSPWPFATRSSTLHIARPLLGEPRTEVLGYLEALGVTPRIDPTNAASRYARNRIRHEVMPELESVNAQARAHLAEFAERAAQDDAALERWARDVFQSSGGLERSGAWVRRRVLTELPRAVAKRVIAVAAAELGLELDAPQREAVLAIAGRRGRRIDLVGGYALTAEENLELFPRNR